MKGIAKMVRIIFSISLFISLLQAEFIRDNTKEIVIDTSTNLIWQDNNDTSLITKTWTNTISYCESLSLGGYQDWKLPNINELQSLVDINAYNPAISDTFQNIVSLKYWSSTAKSSSFSWYVNFQHGYDDYIGGYETDKNYIRCVRVAD